jgi:saposin
MLQTSEGMDLKGDTTCTLCKWAVEEIEKALNFGHNEEIILETLIDGCTDSFEHNPILQDTCIALVNTTIKDIIDLLQEGLTPANICSALKLCDPPSVVKIEKLPLTHASIFLQYGDLKCTLCKKTVTTIEEQLGLGHLEEWIIGNFTEDCKDIFGNFPVFEETCLAFVNGFVKDILDLLKEGLEPEHICEIIGLCPRPTTEAPPPPTTHHDPTTEVPVSTTEAPPPPTTHHHPTTQVPVSTTEAP